MKANTTVPKIYNLFQHPGKRFTGAVSTIADSRIEAYHAEHGNGYTEEEITAMVQEIIAQQETPVVPADCISFGGEIDESPADVASSILVAENVGKIYNVHCSFDTSSSQYFYDEYTQPVNFPAGTNVLVVPVEETIEDNPETVYKFDILHGLSKTSEILRFDAMSDEITIDFGSVSLSGPVEDSVIGFRIQARTLDSNNQYMETLYDAQGLFRLEFTIAEGHTTVKAYPFEGAATVASPEATEIKVEKFILYLQC